MLVAKQAAAIDRLSGGRMVLGIAVGGREGDYKALGARFANRGRKIERQVRKIRRTWRAAKRASDTEGLTGPPPLQKPLPPIWFGGMGEPAIRRATVLGDGFVFGTTGPELMAKMTPQIRAWASEAGKKKFAVGGIAYCAVGDDPAAALDRGARAVMRYYKGNLWTEPANLIHHGPPEVIAAAVKEYEEAGLDFLILFPEIPEVAQVEQLAEHVLPPYRVPAKR